MRKEAKTCQNCKKEFTIESEDFVFYQKMQVPPPTFCPPCREARRAMFRNAGTFYKRRCDLCKKDIVSTYTPDAPYMIYYPECYWSDKWDAYTYGRDYDFSRSFFEQFKDLQRAVPRMSLMQENAVESPYTNFVRNVKNCYLDIGSEYGEDGAYSDFAVHTKNYLDSYWIFNSEFAYELVKSDKCYRAFYSFWCFNSYDIWFSYDCSGCSNVIGGYGLRNKNYHIFNKPVSKEEYRAFAETYLSGSHEKIKELSERVYQFFLTRPHRSAFIHNSIGCTGNFIESSKNAKQCWHADGVQDSKFASILLKTRDSYDIYAGIDDELVYEAMSCGESHNVKFSYLVWRGCRDMEYSNNMYGGNDCFGSVGLKKGSFSILNKQHREEEYYALREKIIQHMNTMPYKDRKGRIYRYGEFFPHELSPFGYNETVAQDSYPLTQNEAISHGFPWQGKNYEAKYEFSSYKVPDTIQEVTDDILGKILKCEVSGKAYRLIPMELAFYRNFNIPIPRHAPHVRRSERLKKLLSGALYPRKCQCLGNASFKDIYQNTASHSHKEHPCPNIFQTPYAPDCAQIIYCEQCYIAEVV